jgi:hypothetical protein
MHFREVDVYLQGREVESVNLPLNTAMCKANYPGFGEFVNINFIQFVDSV